MTERYIFTGSLLTLTGLHVGSGRAALDTDAALVRSVLGRPLIPGSSFKGALRSAVESLAASLPDVRTCQLTEGRADCLSVSAARQGKYRDRQEARASDAELDALLMDRTGAFGLCDTCRLFGSPFRESKLRVADLPLLQAAEPATEVRHGVGIDRDTGTARDQIKFDYEALGPDVQFAVELTLEAPDSRDLGLLAAGLRELQLGQVPLGGHASRGLGRCQLHLERVVRVDLSNRRSVLAYLRQSSRTADGRLRANGSQSWEGHQHVTSFLDEKIEAWLSEG